MTLTRRSCAERHILCVTPLTPLSQKAFESDFSLGQKEGDASSLAVNPQPVVGVEPVQAVVARANPCI